MLLEVGMRKIEESVAGNQSAPVVTRYENQGQ